MHRHNLYHSLLAAFQVEVIKRALAAAGGNRTHAARLLGLQRTYLLRLMRDRGIDVPPARGKGRSTLIAGTTPPEFHIEIRGWEPLAPPNGDNPHPAIATDAASL
ncbi:MAG: helix-turn-helix domain-containing protein [Candidatus Eiseniibacteriota bacterium]